MLTIKQICISGQHTPICGPKALFLGGQGEAAGLARAPSDRGGLDRESRREESGQSRRGHPRCPGSLAALSGLEWPPWPWLELVRCPDLRNSGRFRAGPETAASGSSALWVRSTATVPPLPDCLGGGGRITSLQICGGGGGRGARGEPAGPIPPALARVKGSKWGAEEANPWSTLQLSCTCPRERTPRARGWRPWQGLCPACVGRAEWKSPVPGGERIQSEGGERTRQPVAFTSCKHMDVLLAF